jgi:hypothetical protein
MNDVVESDHVAEVEGEGEEEAPVHEWWDEIPPQVSDTSVTESNERMFRLASPGDYVAPGHPSTFGVNPKEPLGLLEADSALAQTLHGTK